jgi:hypothetical protein
LVFYFLAKEKSLAQRAFASVHGWAALSIFPSSTLIASQYPNVKVGVGLPIILVLGSVSAVSVFYAIATVRRRWAYHLLHIPTLFVIAISVVASLFILADHH